MPTYLLTWNPKQWNGNIHSTIDWSCGNSLRIRKGDRLFLMRQGVEPRGICASGWAISDVFEDVEKTRRVRMQIDMFRNPEVEPILLRETLLHINQQVTQPKKWDIQVSGTEILAEVAQKLEEAWRPFYKQSAQPELDAERQRIESEGYFNAENLEDARRRVTASIVQRQGQGKFRRTLLDAYGGRCPITGCDAKPAIEAAHIVPYQGTETNHPKNGLPLRADIHILFDLHLLSIRPESYEIVVAPELAVTCYQEFAGRRLTLPQSKAALPDQAALSRHYGTFLQKCTSS